MESKDILPIGRKSNFWVRVIELRLRFVLLIALVAIVFTAFPWMSNAWTKFTAGIVDGLDNSVSGDSEFFCPMDPGVVSPWPAICPICNMDLVKRSKTEAQILPSGAISRMQFTPYRISLAGVKSSLAEPDGKNAPPATEESKSSSTTTARYKVPLSSIVYWDRNPLVYVESMAHMFDAVPVKIVDRAGDHYIIETSWATPLQVATLGTFLLDAETRLNPSMSTQYFGASQNLLASENAPTIPQKQDKSKKSLSPEEQQLVSKQQICPITKADLNSMGGPVIVDVQGRKLAICCEGCRSRVLATPEKHLQWLDQQLHEHRQAE